MDPATRCALVACARGNSLAVLNSDRVEVIQEIRGGCRAHRRAVRPAGAPCLHGERPRTWRVSGTIPVGRYPAGGGIYP
jgi:hypothetical protein